MSPPPAPVAAAPRQSEGEESQESRWPREGRTDPSAPQDLETQAGRDVIPPNAWWGSGHGLQRARRTEGENALEGRNPGRHRRAGPERVRRTERARHRDRGPEADRVRTLLKERGESTRATAGGQGSPRGGPTGARRRPWRVKPRDARVPSGTRRDGGGHREGGDQTSHAVRRGAAKPRGSTGLPSRHVS